MPNASSRFDAADMVSQSLSLPIRIATHRLVFTMLSQRLAPMSLRYCIPRHWIRSNPHDTLVDRFAKRPAERGDASTRPPIRDRFVAAPRGRAVEDHAVRPIPKRVEAVDRVALR